MNIGIYDSLNTCVSLLNVHSGLDSDLILRVCFFFFGGTNSTGVELRGE